jgi:hypothetical protein
MHSLYPKLLIWLTRYRDIDISHARFGVWSLAGSNGRVQTRENSLCYLGRRSFCVSTHSIWVDKCGLCQSFWKVSCRLPLRCLVQEDGGERKELSEKNWPTLGRSTRCCLDPAIFPSPCVRTKGGHIYR